MQPKFEKTNIHGIKDFLFFFVANVTPFRIRVVFDDTEEDMAVAGILDAANEQSVSPGGIIGFRITFMQMNECTT